ncbi:MAG: hypothetical protein N4A33_04720 [Bacteriovoracaceae bacterium]|jgi:hypothetical protein|nr:hypothetical protein [Bacteriovoracaceae bacterium]
MKLLALVLISTSIFASTRIIDNGDIIKKKYLRIDVDGMLLREFPKDQRQAAIKAFEHKCLVEIPDETTEHYRALQSNSNFFNVHDIHGEYRVIKSFTKRFGPHYICQADIYTSDFSNIYFEAHYSEIYRAENTLGLCKKKLEEIDQTAEVDGVLTRRAYFTIFSNGRRGFSYPECQTMKIIVKEEN